MGRHYCIFCDYGKRNPPGEINDENVFMSTNKVVGFLDIQPLVTASAHILIVPRKHYGQLNEMENDDEFSAALGVALPKVSSALLKCESIKAKAFNVVQNNGIDAGQVVDHVHFHIVMRPRNGDPETEKVKSLLMNGPEDKEWSLKERLSYSAHIFGRGHRQDLDIDWMNTFLPELRDKLKYVNLSSVSML